uniref:Uncharacterized protein n=1 Tax=Romanomermis culicivorax TaxID=13658 RepID=A0A915HGE0_ROMCU
MNIVGYSEEEDVFHCVSACFIGNSLGGCNYVPVLKRCYYLRNTEPCGNRGKCIRLGDYETVHIYYNKVLKGPHMKTLHEIPMLFVETTSEGIIRVKPQADYAFECNGENDNAGRPLVHCVSGKENCVLYGISTNVIEEHGKLFQNVTVISDSMSWLQEKTKTSEKVQTVSTLPVRQNSSLLAKKLMAAWEKEKNGPMLDVNRIEQNGGQFLGA